MEVPTYFSITVGYKDIYNDYDQFDINQELKKTPSWVWLKIISHFNALMHTNDSEKLLQVNLFQAWKDLLDKHISEKINTWSSKIAKRNSLANLINNKTSLMFIEKVYENFNENEEGTEITVEQYEIFFKCYLYLSQSWADQAQKLTFKYKDKTEKYLYLFFPLQFSMIEIIEVKDFRLQFIKGIYFFKYCENNPDYRLALSQFIQSKNVTSWQRYLINFLGPYVKLIPTKGEIPSSSLTLKEATGEMIKFFDALCANPATYKKFDDYKYLRNFPLFKYKDQYLFVFLNFFIDKLYQALKFEFGGTLINGGYKFKGENMHSLTDFLRHYGEDFAEKGLFYEVIEFCFSKKKNYLLKRGEDLKRCLIEGEPDYYIRDRNKIYLFEFKDVLISHSAKSSINYNQIVDELDKKFLHNKRGEPKGIKQLINSIQKIIRGEYQNKGVDSFHPNEVIIFPILIFTDATLNTRGVNYYLNNRYKELLIEKGINSNYIRPLTLIDIDSLIGFQDLFHENRLTLNHCLNYFHEIIQKSEIEDKVYTFSMAINKKASKFKYDKTPKIFWDTIKEVLKKKN